MTVAIIDKARPFFYISHVLNTSSSNTSPHTSPTQCSLSIKKTRTSKVNPRWPKLTSGVFSGGRLAGFCMFLGRLSPVGRSSHLSLFDGESWVHAHGMAESCSTLCFRQRFLVSVVCFCRFISKSTHWRHTLGWPTLSVGRSVGWLIDGWIDFDCSVVILIMRYYIKSHFMRSFQRSLLMSIHASCFTKFTYSV